MENYLIIIDIIGIIAFTISGYIISVKNNLDILGVFLISFITALGGGIIRDTILNKTPFTFSEIYPSLTVVIILILSYIFKLHQKEELELNNNKLYIVSDSLGLVFFSILGANLALNAHYNFFGIILISLLTATGGGIIRDISLNKVPTIFKEDFYGSISIILGILIYLETYFNIYTVYITYLNISVGLIIRFIVLKYKIKVPQIK